MGLFDSLKKTVLGVEERVDPALKSELKRRRIFDIAGKAAVSPEAVRIARKPVEVPSLIPEPRIPERAAARPRITPFSFFAETPKRKAKIAITAPIRFTAGTLTRLLTSIGLEKANSDLEFTPRGEFQELLIGKEPIRRLQKESITSQFVQKKLQDAGLSENLAKKSGLTSAILVGAFIENPFLFGTGAGAKVALKKTLRKMVEEELGEKLVKEELQTLTKQADEIFKLGTKEEKEQAIKRLVSEAKTRQIIKPKKVPVEDLKKLTPEQKAEKLFDLEKPKLERIKRESVIEIPEKKIFAKLDDLDLKQIKRIDDEIRAIPSDADDIVHLSQLDTRVGKLTEVSIDEIKKVSANAKKALEDLKVGVKKEIAEVAEPRVTKLAELAKKFDTTEEFVGNIKEIFKTDKPLRLEEIADKVGTPVDLPNQLLTEQQQILSNLTKKLKPLIDNKILIVEEPVGTFIRQYKLNPKVTKQQLADISKKVKVIPEVKPTKVVDTQKILDEAKVVKKVEPKKPKPKKKEVKQVFKKEKFKLTPKDEKTVSKAFKESGLESRTTKTFDEISEEATKVDIDATLAKPNKELTDAEVVALTEFSNASAKRIAELSKKVADNPHLQLEIDLITDQLNEAVAKQVTGGTALGRSIAAFKIQARETLEPSYWLRQAKRQLGDETVPENVIVRINQFIEKGQRDELAQFVANLGRVSWLEKITTLRKAGLLTNIKTDIKNIASNTLFKILDDTADVFIARPIDFVAGLLTKKRTTNINMVEALKSWSQFSDGARQGIEQLRTGIDKSVFKGNKIEYRKAFNRFSENKAERTLARYTDTIFNRLEAEDKPFKAMAYAKSLQDQAKTAGINNGLKGKELESFIDKAMKEPTQVMKDQAIGEALEMTFQADNMLNDMWRGVLHSLRKGEVKAKNLKIKNKAALRLAQEIAFAPRFILEMVNPFAKVGTNLFLRGLEFTPAGFLNTLVKATRGNQKEAVKSASRAITGSIIMASLYAWIRSDDNVEIKFRELEKSKERKQRLRTGEQPSAALKIGDLSISFQGVDPIPTFFLGAGIIEKIKDGEMTIGEGITEYGKSRLDETYVRGIKDLLNVPDYGLDWWLKSQAASFVPTIANTLAKVFDNQVRGYDTVPEAMMARIPVLRGFLPPKLDAFGREIKYNKDPLLNAVNQIINPFAVSKIDINSVDRELTKINDRGFDVLPSETIKTVRVKGKSVDLTQKEVNLIQKVRGRNIWNGLRDLFRSDEYRSAEDSKKATMIRSVYNESLREAKKRVTSKIIKSKDLEPIEKLDYLISADIDQAVDFFNKNKRRIKLRELPASKKKKLEKKL